MTVFKASAMTVNDKFTRYSWLDKICSRVRFGINNTNARNFKFVIYPNTLQCVIFFVFERYQWVSLAVTDPGEMPGGAGPSPYF